jgi:3-isopropylmalate/(R)-2-methylmalate dehydratase small subunit
MDKFTTLTAVAAPMPLQNIDTDKVIPARFLKTIKRSGLGVHLFDPLRFDSAGKERPEFILNQEPYRHAQGLVSRGTGNDGPVSTAAASSFLNAAGTMGG